MEVLQQYLLKYKKLAPPQATKAKLIAKVIQDECGVSLDSETITVRRGGATLSCHPTVRSEVVRCVPRVLEVLQRDHNVRLSFIR